MNGNSFTNYTYEYHIATMYTKISCNFVDKTQGEKENVYVKHIFNTNNC